MIQDDGPLTFALTLKRWFASNGWPQKITQDWAEDKGVLNPHGPWASQMCGAMKASGYNPKAEFFLALAEFNHFVEQQNTQVIVNSKLRDRLEGAKPLYLDNGQPYKAPDFWSLYAGLIEPPKAFASKGEMTQEDVDAAVKLMRDNFRQVSLNYMVSPATAWQMIHAAIIEASEKSGIQVSPDDIQQFKEVLAGLFEHTPETLVPLVQRYGANDPVVAAFDVLLKDEGKKQQPIDSSKRRSAQISKGQ